MDSKQTRQGELRIRIIECAEKTISEYGQGAISARALAQDAGCAVGAIYNVFEDLKAIVEAVNLRSFEAMRRFVASKIAEANSPDPKYNLTIAARSYLQFALENQNIWMAIFEIEMVPLEKFSKAYLEKSDALFGMIESLVAQIYEKEDKDEVRCLTRTIFSAVHGIVIMGVERRLLSVEREDLDKMVSWLMASILR